MEIFNSNYVIIAKETLQAPVKTLLILSTLATLFSIGVFITIIAQGYTGLGTAYSSSTTCNVYLAIKYENQRAVGFRVRFIESIIAMICLTIETILNIRSFLQVSKIQQQKSAQIFQWTQNELNLKYICESIAVISLIPVFAYYLSIIIQEGGCFHRVELNWIIMMIESLVSFLLAFICWIVFVKYSISRKFKAKPGDYETNIKLQQIRQRQADMKNLFDIQGSELYRTLKRQNRDVVQPLLVHNDPIPLFNNQMDITSRQQQAKVRFYHDKPQQQVPTITHKKNSSNISIPFQNERKKSTSPQKLSSSPISKSRVSAMIQQKKNRFREINPLKQSAGKHKIEDQKYEEEFISQQNQMKNLPKPYIQYIKQSKKPKRNPPNFDIILQNFNKEENEKRLALQAQEEKPFLKKYRKDQDQKIQKQEENEQIQFIDEVFGVIIQGQKPNQKQEKNKLENQAELFFHKPRTEKNLRKKRKLLFQEDVIDTTQLNEKDSKQLIINKIKQAKNNKLKLANKPQPIVESIKSPKKKNIQSKQDIMLSFLKNKYSAQQQIAGNQEED